MGSFSATFCGTGSFAASSASSPKRALRLEAAWRTTPFSTVTDEAGTDQRAAAVATSMARAAAPAMRSSSQLLATAVEPPVPWMPKKWLA